MKKTTDKAKVITLSLLIGLTLASGVTYAAAAWQDTDWMQKGAKIDSSKIKKSLDYLRENAASITARVTNIENITNGGTWPTNITANNLTSRGYVRSTRYGISAPRYDNSFYVLQSQHWYGHNGSQTMYLGEAGNTISVRGKISTGTPTSASHVATKGYVDNIRKLSEPPTCIGTNRYLQWTGSAWACSNASVGK